MVRNRFSAKMSSGFTFSSSSERESDRDNLQSQLDRLGQKLSDEGSDIRNEMRKENLKRVDEANSLKDLFR